MNKLYRLSILVLFILLVTLQIGVTSCTKDSIKYDTVYVISKDTIPTVFAGHDTTIQLNSSIDSILLKGSATDPHDSIVSYLWSQVSGPNNVKIIFPGAS